MTQTIKKLIRARDILLETASQDTESGYILYLPDNVDSCIDELTEVLEMLGVRTDNETLH